MIIDKINNCGFYYGLGEKFEKAFKYLKETDLVNLECGKYSIDGEEIFASVDEYYTKNSEQCLWEVHKQYIDIQYIISGSEKMGYSNISNINTTIEYNLDNDILFGEGVGQFVIVNEGEFIIFTNNDAHMPCIEVMRSERVKKVVVKVLNDKL